MKRILTMILACVLILACMEPMFPEAKAAQVIDSGKAGANITWKIYDDGLLEFSGYGAMDDNQSYINLRWSSNYNDFIERIVFKSGITYIGRWTFNSAGKYSKLKSVTIPSTVTKIGSYAFNFSSTMEEVHITDLAKWCNIEFENDYANPLGGRDLYVNDQLVKDLVIPSSVSKIGAYAFKGCRSIQTVDIGKNVKEIGAYAFNSCFNLGKLVFRGNAPTMGDHMLTLSTVYAYYPGNNNTWTSDVMQDYGGQTTWVPYDPAKDEVTSDDFPRKYINWSYDEATKTLTLSGYGETANYGTYSPPPWSEYKKQFVHLVVEEGITGLGKSSFSSCSVLEDVSLPSTLETLASNAFASCPSLKAVSMPAVKTIGESAFNNCAALVDITLPDGLQTVDYQAFLYCLSLKQINLPDSVETIGRNAFYQCPSLQGIWVAEGNPNFSSDSYGVLMNKDQSVLIRVPGGMTGCYVLPDTVKSFGSCALVSKVREYTIPGSVEVLPDALFGGTELEKVTFLDGVQSFEYRAFMYCQNLKEIHFLGDCPEFSRNAMYNVYDLEFTAYYPRDNETWTEDKLQKYGGMVTWVPYPPLCEEHQYASTVTEPTCSEQGYTTYTCTKCGESYVGDYTDPVDHIYEYDYCKWCGQGAQSIRWYSATTSLNGTIDLNIYVLLSKDLVEADDTFVRFTYSGGVVNVPMSKALHSPTDQYPNRYRFSCPIYAKQLADNVTVKFMKGDAQIGKDLNYSVVKYCVNQIAKVTDPQELALYKAMLNYGTAAQLMFEHNVENLANASLTEEEKALPDVDASAYKYSISGKEEGIRAKSATLMLEDVVKVRVYFALTGDKAIEDYTFTIDGQVVTPQQNDKGYYVETSGIAAKDLEKMFEIQVGGITVTYGALSYVNSKANGSNQLEANISKALYVYWQAADSYLG